ncbi:MAG: hypothetical protein PHI36_05090 [Bacteroidales bacterium]|nr:hypothetical protein [Bacteroidales bacterium]
MIKKNIIIFSSCAIISMVGWLSIKLSKNYYQNFILRYEIKNIPKNIRLSSENNTIKINFKADGFKLANMAKTIKTADYFIDFSELNYYKNTSNGVLKIPSELIVSQYNKKYLNEVEIIQFSPDTLVFQTFEIRQKKVPIVTVFKIPESNMTFETELTKLPDSVFISGDKNHIDTISVIYSEAVDIRIFALEEIQNAKLLSPSKSISLSHNSVDIRLSSPNKIYIKQNIKLLPQSEKEFIYIPEQSFAVLEYETELSKMSNLVPDSFKVEMNLNEKHDNIAPLKLTKHPQGMNKILVSPSVTSFVKSKKP